MRRASSLQGRLLWVLLAVVGVAVVLLGPDYLALRSGVADRAAQRSAAAALGEALADVDAAIAAAVVRATELLFNRSRCDGGLLGIQDLAFKLQTRDG